MPLNKISRKPRAKKIRKATAEEVAAYLIDFMNSPACSADLQHSIADFFDAIANEANADTDVVTKATFPIYINILTARKGARTR